MKFGFVVFLLAAMIAISGCTGTGDANAPKTCGECPLLSPPGPDFCPAGNIVGGGVDECGCQQPPSCEMTVGCTEDAKVCEDGTTLVRDPNNNCQFPACPEIVEGDVKETYCKPEQRGNVPCTREYMPVCGWFGKDIQCIKYPCAATYGNKCGACADEKVAYWTQGECPEAPEPEKSYCTPEQKAAKICTMEYMPVCGFTEEEAQVETFGNKCGACADEQVAYYLEGECPKLE